MSDLPHESASAMISAGESLVREALRSQLLAQTPDAKGAIAELWVPRTNERADLAVIGRRMDGFEIKTERDTLRRLPRQAIAYGRLFDRCTVVVAERHAEGADRTLPPWWGITTTRVNGSVSFTSVRAAKANPELDPEVLVRLLWRDEAMAALVGLGYDPDSRAPRASLWRQLLSVATLTQLRRAVREAIVHRDPPRM